MPADHDREATGFPYRAGDAIGPSPWVAVTQAMIDQFGAATLDPDPMHIEPEWARRHSPFGGTVAYGFLTMSLLTHLLRAATGDVDRPEGAFINYGFDRLRLIAPVPADAHVRGTFTMREIRRTADDRELACFACEVAIAGSDRPALVGDWLALWIPPSQIASAQ
ncbi:MAG: MaoC/PaaZ C-terminal domain-containing protein [Thermaurantiacus sp.]